MSQKLRQLFSILLVLTFVVWLGLSVFPLDGGDTKVLNSKSEAKRALYEPSFEDEGDLSFYNETDSLLSSIDIEIADNEQEISYGMMNRKSIDENTGMLFILPLETEQSFWMKNTYLSLDVVYINSEFEIVSIQKNTEPLSETQLPSNGPAKYALELKAGYSDAHFIKAGHKVKFQRH